MPIMKRFPALERVRQESGTSTSTGSAEDFVSDDYHNMQKGDDDYMSDGSIYSEHLSSRTTPPALPPKSQLRASRTIETLVAHMQSMEEAARQKQSDKTFDNDPYVSYASSEEDGSVSADDYDESMIELDRDISTLAQPLKRRSRVDTAKAVSFMFLGKPHLVDIAPHDQFKRHSMDHVQPVRQRPSNLRHASAPYGLSSMLERPSSPTSSSNNVSLDEHKDEERPASRAPSSDYSSVRSHSAKDSITSSIGLSSAASSVSLASKHSVLDSDSLPTSEVPQTEPRSLPTELPTSPGGTVDAAWKSGLKNFQRSFSLAGVKRSSMLKLTPPPPSKLSSQHGSTTALSATPMSPTSPVAARPSPDRGPVSYQDIMRNVIREPPPRPESSLAKTSRSGGLFGLGTQRSNKGVMRSMHGAF
jgi:hypothetical protein